MRVFFRYWIPVIAYCVIIYIQSAYPSPIHLPQSISHGDKLLHFVGYALLGAMFFRAFRASFLKINPWILMGISILTATFYGASDEFHQYFVSYRTADLMDFLADALGSAAGTAGYYMKFGKRPV